MPRPVRRRRHRSGDRESVWLQPVVLGIMAAVGTSFLVTFLMHTPAGSAAMLGTTAVLAMVAFLMMSCLTGRFAAWLRNGMSFYFAHTELAKFMRGNANFRAARRAIDRP